MKKIDLNPFKSDLIPLKKQIETGKNAFKLI